MKNIIYSISIIVISLTLFACPTDYSVIPTVVLVNQSGRDLKVCLIKSNPGDSNLIQDLSIVSLGMSSFEKLTPSGSSGGTAVYVVCAWNVNPYDAHTIRECIDLQPSKRLYYFVFDPDTIDHYGLEQVMKDNNYIYRGYVDSNSEFSTTEERVTGYYP